MESKIIKELNTGVCLGILPVAYFNVNVVDLEKNQWKKQNKKIDKVHEKYNQIKIPEGSSLIIISKIYELY